MSTPEDESVTDYIKRVLDRELKRRIAEMPWWCGICGASGNGYRAGMDVRRNVLPPPDEHYDGDCNPKFDKLRGIEA